MTLKKKISLGSLAALLVGLTILTIVRWEVWFGNPPEDPYVPKAAPTRVLLTFGNDGEMSRNVSWMCDTVVHKSHLELLPEGGDQPIFNEDKSKLITFNGEIYNFRELREDLISKGHDFTTHADTEVILHGYEEYGVELLQKLRGMFAFVIWDREKQELFGARDHFGIKPLYYTQMGGTFMYGSEIKSFLKHPNFKKELNKESEITKEDKLLAFLGGKFIIYILLIVILLGIAIYLYTEISYIFTPINAIVSSIMTPIIVAYIFYYILNPLVNFFSKKMSRFLASLLAIVVGVIVILVVIIGMVPIVVEQTKNLITSLPRYIEIVKGYLDTYSDNAYVQVVIEYINNNLNISQLSSKAVEVATLVAQNIASSLSSTASVLITMPFVLFFLLKDATTFNKYFISILPKKLEKPVAETIEEIDDKVGSYIQGQMLVSLCIGVMLFIGYNIIGLHYAFSLATIAAFLSIVPYLGPVIAITPAMLVAASTSWVMVIKMLVVWGIVQFLEGNIISPNIMGRSMKMHPLTVIFVILIGVNMAGVVGAILGIPVYSILKVLIVKLLTSLKNRYDKYYG